MRSGRAAATIFRIQNSPMITTSRTIAGEGVSGAISAGNQPDVSVVIPCLNEARSIGACVDQALSAFEAEGIRGEVVVSDNGSSDESIRIAEARGARVVHTEVKGYGSALRNGIENAQGNFIILGDADGSHDFREIGQFVAKWR